MFDNIIFDLDNTLYNYNLCHEIALNNSLEYIQSLINIKKDLLLKYFNDEKKIHKIQTSNTATSHNKYIQFKKLLDFLKINLLHLDDIFNIYINSFNEQLKLYDYVLDFIKLLHSNNVKLYILTNNTCREQINRLKNLNILNYFDKIFTSEEFNTEKPDLKLYYNIIGKIGCNINTVAMIGDSYKDDIEPSIYIGIYGFLLNKQQINIKIKSNFT